MGARTPPPRLVDIKHACHCQPTHRSGLLCPVFAILHCRRAAVAVASRWAVGTPRARRADRRRLVQPAGRSGANLTSAPASAPVLSDPSPSRYRILSSGSAAATIRRPLDSRVARLLDRDGANGGSVCLSVCPSVTLVIHAYKRFKISKRILHHA